MRKSIERRWIMSGQINSGDVNWVIEQIKKNEEYEEVLKFYAKAEYYGFCFRVHSVYF